MSRFQRRDFQERRINSSRRRFDGFAFIYLQEDLNMSSGVQVSKNGAVTGTGANLDIRVVGFRPRRVELVNLTGLVTAYWADTMADGTGIKRVTAGDMTAMVAGITPLSDGFRIGTDADLNVAGEIVHWTAHE